MTIKYTHFDLNFSAVLTFIYSSLKLNFTKIDQNFAKEKHFETSLMYFN